MDWHSPSRSDTCDAHIFSARSQEGKKPGVWIECGTREYLLREEPRRAEEMPRSLVQMTSLANGTAVVHRQIL